MSSTKRKRRHARERAALSDAQFWNLVLGRFSNAFESEEECRQAWIEHRDEILKDIPYPWALVQYELGGFLPEEGARISKALKRLGIETDERKK